MHQKRYHIIIDVSNVSEEVLSDEAGLGQFLAHMPSHIGMHVLRGPVLARGIPENPGLSGFVIIDYSHISAHTFTKFKEVLVDIFSCKPYEKEKAIEETLQYFHASRDNAIVKEVSWGDY